MDFFQQYKELYDPKPAPDLEEKPKPAPDLEPAVEKTTPTPLRALKPVVKHHK